MEIKIELISKETIKPSSPTPKSQESYQLSYLDQIAPHNYFMPFVYFYPSHPTLPNSELSNHLKKSFSQTLTAFYPLAGRLANDHLVVHCHDQGAPFLEAEAGCDLAEVITKPVPANMNKLLPCRLDDVHGLGVAVQVTYFRCGGVAVGLVMSHKIADALSLIQFANTWAALARNDESPPPPVFEAAKFFPPGDVGGFELGTGMEEEFASKIFTFSSSKISVLRERYAGAVEFRPTRVEALSAFLWNRIASVTEIKQDPNKVCALIHPVNLRTRFDPPLPENHFGNLSQVATATVKAGDDDHESLQKVREAVKGVNGEYVIQLKECWENHLSSHKERIARACKGELVMFVFTSLCRLPLYRADFGWGKPVWVGSAKLPYTNMFTLMDDASGGDGGIEAWMNLKKEDMEEFEADLELQDFLS